MPVEAVILAAGLGTRLGRPYPKPLTRLRTGESILRRAVDSMVCEFGDDVRLTAVVGFKMDLIIEETPDICFVYNEVYDSTNTSKSLLKGLRLSGPGGVLWMNGDVVFDPGVTALLRDRVAAGRSFVCVNRASVGEEEVKYTLDERGYVAELSKSVEGGLGEAIGINYVSAADKATLVRCLEAVDDGDYFERALELAIAEHGLQVEAVDLSDLRCVEVDFERDLSEANLFVTSGGQHQPPGEGAGTSG